MSSTKKIVKPLTTSIISGSPRISELPSIPPQERLLNYKLGLMENESNMISSVQTPQSKIINNNDIQTHTPTTIDLQRPVSPCAGPTPNVKRPKRPVLSSSSSSTSSSDISTNDIPDENLFNSKTQRAKFLTKILLKSKKKLSKAASCFLAPILFMKLVFPDIPLFE